jgi:hypothetical protein
VPESGRVLRQGDGVQVDHAEEMLLPRSALPRQLGAPPFHSACMWGWDIEKYSLNKCRVCNGVLDPDSPNPVPDPGCC